MVKACGRFGDDIKPGLAKLRDRLAVGGSLLPSQVPAEELDFFAALRDTAMGDTGR